MAEGILNLDGTMAVAPESFDDVEEAVLADHQGVNRWVLEKTAVPVGDVLRSASSLGIPNLHGTFTFLVTAGDGDNPPDSYKIGTAANTAGGTSAEIEARVKRASCQHVAEFLWRCSNHGGFKLVDDIIVSRNSISPRKAAAPGQREQQPPRRSMSATTLGVSPAGPRERRPRASAPTTPCRTS